MNFWDSLKEYEMYCPICSRTIVADNIKEVWDGEHDCFYFVHDNIPHTEADVLALQIPIQ